MLPVLLRELQQKGNCGQGSHYNSSLNYRRIESNVENCYAVVLGSMDKNNSALAVFNKNSIQTGSLEKSVIPRHAPRPH